MTDRIEVTATKWQDLWELDIHGYGVTQSRTLAQAEGMVRDYISDDVDSVADLEIVMHYALPEAEEAAKVRDELARLTDSLNQASARSRRIASQLKQRGLRGADIARVMKVSPQRVSQLLKD